MTEIKELVEFLDEWIGQRQPSASNEELFKLTEIKGIMEYCEKFKDKIKEIMSGKLLNLPDKELVEKIIDTVDDTISIYTHEINKDEARKEILSLLQSRKPVITIEELKQVLQIKQIPESALNTRLMALAGLFKSKGFKVAGQ